MLLSRFDRLRRGIQPQNRMAAAREGLGGYAGAAPQVQQSNGRGQTRGDALVDPTDAQRVHAMQRAHRAVRLPPARRQVAEFRYFAGING